VTPDTGIGYGLLLDWPFQKKYKFQFGLASLQRKYVAGTAQQSTAYHFPFNFKYLVAKQLALGLGGYYELWSQSGLETMGYGAMASAVLDLPIMPGFGWIIDLRYLYGLRDMDPQAGEKALFMDVVAFTGLRLGFGR
jgi:hypothetical protein